MTDAAQYLLALYIAEHRHSPPVSSGTVAEMLEKSTATVTGAFQRLHRDGLVNYESYEGARLTEEGRERAAERHEAYAALSWFFRSVLELDTHEAEAMRLASRVSVPVSDRIASALPVEEVADGADAAQLPPREPDRDDSRGDSA